MYTKCVAAELWSRRVAVEKVGHILYVFIVTYTKCKAINVSYGKILAETLSVSFQNFSTQ